MRAGRLLELPPIAWAVDFRLVRREERVVVRWEPPAAGGGEHCEDERVAGVDHCSRFAFSFLLNAHSAQHSRVMQAGGLRLGGRQAGRHDHRSSAHPYSPSPNPLALRTRAGEHTRRAGAAGVVQRQLCCVRIGGGGAGQVSPQQGWRHTLCVVATRSRDHRITARFAESKFSLQPRGSPCSNP